MTASSCPDHGPSRTGADATNLSCRKEITEENFDLYGEGDWNLRHNTPPSHPAAACSSFPENPAAIPRDAVELDDIVAHSVFISPETPSNFR